MNNPYRDVTVTTSRKLARRRAFFRGLVRRIIIPTKVVCWIAAGGIAINACVAVDTWGYRDNEIAMNRRHFEDWQASIDNKQQKADSRMREVELKEQEFNSRLHTFEAVVSMSSALMKNGDDNNVNVLLDVLKKTGVSQNTNKKE